MPPTSRDVSKMSKMTTLYGIRAVSGVEFINKRNLYALRSGSDSQKFEPRENVNAWQAE